jgi:PleD family two-component response regulator
MDGIEMCRLIRQHEELQDTPVILMSGTSEDLDSELKGFRVGADDDYLEPPFGPMRLPNVSRLSERKRSQQALGNSEAELRALFAAMANLVLVFDADGRYLHIAPTSTRLLDRPPAQLIGLTDHDVFSIELAVFFLD